MLPLRDDVPARRAPLAVASLGIACVLVFAYLVVLQAAGGTSAAAEFVESWGLVPREFLRGLADPAATARSVWLAPLTAMFVHASLLHLAGNLIYLWVFGRNIEDLLGHGRFLVLYVACGLAAAAVQVASDPASYAAMVGASGAVSGVLGAYLVAYPGGRLRLLWPRVRVPALLFLGLWVALQVLSGLRDPGGESAGVAWWAHVGGFAAGLALGPAMWVRSPTRSRLRI